jgi:hypothetical protein
MSCISCLDQHTDSNTNAGKDNDSFKRGGLKTKSSSIVRDEGPLHSSIYSSSSVSRVSSSSSRASSAQHRDKIRSEQSTVVPSRPSPVGGLRVSANVSPQRLSTGQRGLFWLYRLL